MRQVYSAGSPGKMCYLQSDGPCVRWALVRQMGLAGSAWLSCLSDAAPTLIMHVATCALQVLAVSTHNHYRRVQDRMRKKQQQEARETAAANAGKMQAPAGPSGQAQVSCTSLVITWRWVAGQMSTVVQHLAGEPDVLHHTAAGRCQAAAGSCGYRAASWQPASSAVLLQIAPRFSSMLFVQSAAAPFWCKQATWRGFAHHSRFCSGLSCKYEEQHILFSCCRDIHP